MSTPSFRIGLDVGGTKIAGGLLSWPEGARHARRVIPTHPERGGRAVLDDVLQLARELAKDCQALGGPASAPSGLGVGLCELVDRSGNPASANCVDWLNLPVIEELSSIAPAHLEADVRAAALAEATLGAGRGFASFLYVTVGTGISCCLMLDGRPHLGAHGFTGTLASSPLFLDAALTNSPAGPEPTLEDLASGPALVRRFQAAAGRAVSGHDVLAAAQAGDPAATDVVRTAAEALAAQLAVLIGTLDPAAVIVGGGLGLSNGPYWETLTTAVRRRIWSDRQRQVPIVHALTGTDAGWIGAALACRR